MTDFGIVLEKLIDVLQLEGHELFRTFAEVQFALAVQNALIVFGAMMGLCLGAIYGIRFSEVLIEKFDIDSYDTTEVKVIMPIICAIISMFVFMIAVETITSVYMHGTYPNYYAAKELIRQISYLTP